MPGGSCPPLLFLMQPCIYVKESVAVLICHSYALLCKLNYQYFKVYRFFSLHVKMFDGTMNVTFYVTEVSQEITKYLKHTALIS